MNPNGLAEESEDDHFTMAQRAAAASRKTWASVGVNLFLTFRQMLQAC
jgi:hypothetical protein